MVLIYPAAPDRSPHGAAAAALHHQTYQLSTHFATADTLLRYVA
jgi:hypothetical protein